MSVGWLGTPVVVFVASLIVAGILYGIGRSISAKPKQASREKYRPYACGQEVPAEHVPVVIWVFKFATAFMVVDVVAFLLVLSMGVPFVSPLRELILVYGATLLIALVALIRR